MLGFSLQFLGFPLQFLLSLIRSSTVFVFVFLSGISKLAMAASASTSGYGSYDVFISHRGPDVKKTFAGHLYRRLLSHGLKVFLDQPELQRGDSLTSQIDSAIKTASVHVAVFSPGYADSNWCLDELLQMLETEKPIIPVFYGVKPSELRWAGGKYAQALQSLANKRTDDDQPHQKRLRYDPGTIDSWRNALASVSYICGFDLESCNGDEAELLDLVAEGVLKKVKKTTLHVAKYPTGLDEKIEHFENEFLLQQQEQSGKPLVLGIVGLGGVGKTTLAKELFNRKSSQYKRCCFLSNVREIAGKGTLISLQKKLLKDLTGSDQQIDCVDEGMEKIKQHLSSFHALIVVDDVDHVDQIDSLLPDQTVIPSDSLVLITSRNKDILTSSGIENSSIYKLTGLSEQHSLELFCSHAFQQPYPPSQFESLVNKFLKACGGLPLSLKVFGALLCGKNKQSYWEEQLDKLGRILHKDIKKRLQISVDALDSEEREIFLDIACFFIGEDRDMAVRIWDGCNWKGFQNLEERCLVEVDSENVIHMHDHLRDLGRDITKAPGMVRGTNNLDDLLQSSSVITEVRGIRTVQANRYYDEDENGLSEMTWHRGILQIPASEDGLLERILTRVHSLNLLWLRWYNCPYSSLPSWIPMQNLRVLQVRGKEWTSLWEGELQAPLQLRDLETEGVLWNFPSSIGRLRYLERINISPAGHTVYSHQISRLPEQFCQLQSLKTLQLANCVKMKSLPDSFGDLRNLQRIELSNCKNLKRLPETFGNLIKLKYLDLRFCSKLTMSSETLGNIRTLQQISLQCCEEIEVLPLKITQQRSLKELNLFYTNLKELPNAIGELSNLEDLYVGSPLLDTLPSSLGDLRNLKTLRLEECHELKCLPDSIGRLTQLTVLRVQTCPISELPNSLGDLRNLKTLELEECYELKCLPDSIGRLTQLTDLRVLDCPISELPHSLGDLRNLKTLHLFGLEELKCLPASVGRLTQLTELTVEVCPISELHDSLGDLRNLKTLKLYKLELKCLPASVARLTQLTELRVEECPISELHDSLGDLRKLKTLKLKTLELKCLPASVARLPQLTELTVEYCSISELLRSPGDFCNLNSLLVSCCKEFCCLPASVGLLTQLNKLAVIDCPISELPHSLGDLRNLKTLQLSGLKELECLPASVGLLTQLTELKVEACPISELPHSLGDLRNLKTLQLWGLEELKCLPASVGLLTQLTELKVEVCPISELPWLRDMRNLKMLSLADGRELEELPGIEHLRSLQELWVSGCVKLKKVRGLAQCTQLRTLHAFECSELEDLEGVEQCTSIRSLIANECPKLKKVRGLAQCRKLERLDVSGCSELEDLEGVEQCPSLSWLKAIECPKLRWGGGVMEQLHQRLKGKLWI